ncbi:chromate transporter, CHR family [Corynebacterium efficiens YS-314]|uniref:Putative transport protein n=1 Tax=Corynebacterium efficiens (strain DSM 44549 / YS-314 / AJ 12310 / JCM 11189 / NBRC 100395) TaxID=196164 RepID=Q8FN03_COREF|nr:chromate efflux transporter [Corynebacterium efficiens]EEW49015.1 chromate transporter, CHR family [Corynebacterium efficiens YS-314]BAC19156.1 putative transport protein [Corynebacterium efficiens YS-314]
MTRILEVLRSFGLLGVTAFGGPTAHLGYFREEFVVRRRWLSDTDYSEVVAISQLLPGPGSSQVGLALGYHRAGFGGLLAAWFAFTLPAAVLMTAFAMLIDAPDAGWTRGLLAAAVAVVFHAVSGMARSMASTAITASIAVAAGIAVLALPSTITHLLIIVVAGVVGAVLLRSDSNGAAEQATGTRPVPAWAGVGSLVLLAVGLVAAVVVGGFYPAFFQAGSVVFGGGHVVLPVLEQLVVVPGWINQTDFLAGYSAAQAVPGPMFSFGTYLGAVHGGVLGAVIATVLIFLPGALLMLAGLHFWGKWRTQPTLQAAVRGINAGVVGLLAAALYDPVFTHGITGVPTLAIAAVCWLGLAKWKTPPWSVAVGAAMAGWVLL